MKATLYFEVEKLAVDKEGNPCPAGMKVSMDAEVDDYNVFVSSHTVDEWLEMLANCGPLGHLRTFKGRSRLLTPEEYDEKYEDDEMNEEDDYD